MSETIWLLSRVFVPNSGGASRRVDELAYFLRNEGKRVIIVTSNRSEHESPLQNPIEFINSRVDKFPWFWLFTLKATWKLLRQADKPNIIYINSPIPELFLLVVLCKLLKIKILLQLTLQGCDGPIDYVSKKKYPTFISHFFVNLLGHADLILPLGEGLFRQSIEFGWDKDRILMLPQPKDAKVFCPPKDKNERDRIREEFGCSGEDFLIGFVGYINQRKGVADLIGAWNIARKDIVNGKLVLAGKTDPNDHKMCADLFRELPEDSYKYLGTLTREQVARFMKTLDIFILPSYAEGLPNVVLEAILTGLPSIVSYLPGSTDFLFLETQAALKIKPGDQQGLSKQILTLYQDETLRKKLSQNAILLSQHFTLERLKPKYLEIFKKLGD
ncbi:glycosyltransferase family 4 protein [bacterium]|nr:glycosyltransferase family 4 protein [bacterium]